MSSRVIIQISYSHNPGVLIGFDSLNSILLLAHFVCAKAHQLGRVSMIGTIKKKGKVEL